jgi:hypothetical protein
MFHKTLFLAAAGAALVGAGLGIRTILRSPADNPLGDIERGDATPYRGPLEFTPDGPPPRWLVGAWKAAVGDLGGEWGDIKILNMKNDWSFDIWRKSPETGTVEKGSGQFWFDEKTGRLKLVYDFASLDQWSHAAHGEAPTPNITVTTLWLNSKTKRGKVVVSTLWEGSSWFGLLFPNPPWYMQRLGQGGEGMGGGGMGLGGRPHFGRGVGSGPGPKGPKK